MQLIDKNHIENQINKGYEFKFGDYISKGIDMYKNNFGPVLGSTLLGMIIPLVSLVTMPNIFRAYHKIDSNKPQEATGEIFNFDKAGEYIIQFLIMMFAMSIFIVPFYIYLFTMMQNKGGEVPFQDTNELIILMGLYFVLFIAIMLISTFMFFATAVITFGDYSAIEGIKVSYSLVKTNFLNILGFSFVTGLIGSIGIFACYIGILFTLPVTYCMYYFAYKDILFTKESEIDQIKGI